MYEYSAEVLRVVDGDTVDVLIDCGFSTFIKERVRLKVLRSKTTILSLINTSLFMSGSGMAYQRL